MKNKIGIIVIFILIIISFIFSLIYLPYIDNNMLYVVVEDNTVWKSNGKKWSNSNLRKLKRMSFDKFYSFDAKEYIGHTYLDYNKSLDIYNSNFEKVSLTNGLLSIKTNKPIKNKNTAKLYNDIDELDYPYLEQIFNKYSISENEEMTTFKYTIDLNKDGKEDAVYSISNFYNDAEKSKAFSIIFSVINDNIEVIEDNIVDPKDELKDKALYLKYIVDVDSDDNYELIILKTSYGNVKNDCNAMYKYDNNTNKYVKLIGC